MKYKTDSSENQFLEIPLGWNEELRLRITFIKKNNSIRLNKIGVNNHVFPGPEFEYEYLHNLIEALKKILKDKKNTT